MDEPDDEISPRGPEEFAEAVDLLDDDGWNRLRRLARNQCRSSNPDDAAELLSEALARVLEERRKWPKEVSLAAFLSGVMKSIASEGSKLGFRKEVDSELEEPDEVQCEGRIADDRLFEKQVKGQVLALFADNEDQHLIVEGRFDLMEKDDFVSLFDGDEIRYQTACRGIRRKLDRHPEVKEMIDG